MDNKGLTLLLILALMDNKGLTPLLILALMDIDVVKFLIFTAIEKYFL